MEAQTSKNNGSPAEAGNLKESSESSEVKKTMPDDLDEEESEFVWDEYLEETSSIAATPTSFLHVEKSLLSCFTEGMKLEVPTKDNTNTYWVATVILTCGPLLRVRYEGFNEDRSADFWCDIATSDIHPIGWCLENNKQLLPPAEIKEKLADWNEYLKVKLKDVKTVPQYLLEANGTTPIDLVKQGMKLEIQEKLNPTCVWIATVLENVGGRLLLRYEGASPSEDFWLFYLSYRIHPVGWCKEVVSEYKPPECISSKHTTEEWSQILQAAIDEASKMPLLHDIFENQEKIQSHKFEVGMKLEAINPGNLAQICPATVTQVLNEYFFLVQIDDVSTYDHTPQIICCHADSPYILPKDWAKSNDVKLMIPQGWICYKEDFDWHEYLACYKNEIAPNELFNHDVGEHGFEKGMKLEAVNPFQPNQICAATITRITNHLLWIQLDSIDSFNPNLIVPVSSHDIFPVGWCESNHYPLKPPLSVQQGKGRLMKRVAIYIQEKQRKSEKPEIICDVKAWCPKIYFNHRCFSGPYLSKGRIAELPRDVGPGPVTLVLKEVLSMLINVAYKSSKVLQELQLKGKSNPNMQQCFLKAKYKGKSYRGIVEVLRNSEQLEEFCRRICTKLECCPYLFGPTYVGNTCPEECFKQTKTKYNTSVKVCGKPPGKKRGRKRKIIPPEEVDTNEPKENVEAKSPEETKPCIDQDTEKASTEDEVKDEKQQKRKYVRYVPPKSDIVTRGAKLPNFALGMSCWRRRKKTSPVSNEFVNTLSPASRDSSEENSKPTSETPSEVNTDSIEDKDSIIQELASFPCELLLDSNPLHWSVEEVIRFLKDTDCAAMGRLLKEQDIDGQALLLLTLPIVQEHLELKLGPAIKLCHQVERIKFAFFSQYAK